MKVHKFVIVTSFYHDEEAFHFQSHESLRRLSILANDQLRLCIPVVDTGLEPVTCDLWLIRPPHQQKVVDTGLGPVTCGLLDHRSTD